MAEMLPAEAENLSSDKSGSKDGKDNNAANQKKSSTQKSDNPHAHHRMRLRRRFLTEGLQSFEPHNALELLLFYAIPQKDTNELAHRLIDRFGSFSEVLDAPYDELVKVNGISENSATLICLIPQMMRMYARDIVLRNPISSRENIASYLYSQLISEQVEKVMLVSLDNKGNMLACDCISSGSLESTPLDQRALIQVCMRRNATAAILSHNHPRGRSYPSSADISATLRVKNALDTIEVRLLDHIIISTESAYSMCSDERYRHIFRKSS